MYLSVASFSSLPSIALTCGPINLVFLGFCADMASSPLSSGSSCSNLGAATCDATPPPLPPQQQEREEVIIQTFEDVARADAEFQVREKAEALNQDAEAAAMIGLFSNVEACKRCAKRLGSDRWETIQSQWQQWAVPAVPAAPAPAAGSTFPTTTTATTTTTRLGREIARVVEELDAPHLKPSGISERLDNGVDAACYGLATLLSHLNKSVQ